MRLEMSRRTDIALEALGILASSDGMWSGKDLAELTATSPTFLAQALAPLIEIEVVQSRSGRSGGYGLGTRAWAVSVLEVVEAVEGPIDSDTCVLAGGPCGVDECALHTAWQASLVAMVQVLASLPAIKS
ncbi:MAG: Rrf2 family transcriptional regulator [Actinomycetia bacterium]|nr:Rrf2 family transcriptional regulator [Actinomycetes bacterium]